MKMICKKSGLPITEEDVRMSNFLCIPIEKLKNHAEAIYRNASQKGLKILEEREKPVYDDEMFRRV